MRVAVLDDEVEAARTVSILLRRLDIDAVTFIEAQPLLARAEQGEFDAYVVDWALGSDTAAPVIRSLRALPASKLAPIIVLSGNLSLDGEPVDPLLASTLTACGAVFRRKPYSIRKLAAELRAALAAESHC